MLSGKIAFSLTVSFLGLPVAQSFEILRLADHLTFKESELFTRHSVSL